MKTIEAITQMEIGAKFLLLSTSQNTYIRKTATDYNLIINGKNHLQIGVDVPVELVCFYIENDLHGEVLNWGLNPLLLPNTGTTVTWERYSKKMSKVIHR